MNAGNNGFGYVGGVAQNGAGVVAGNGCDGAIGLGGQHFLQQYPACPLVHAPIFWGRKAVLGDIYPFGPESAEDQLIAKYHQNLILESSGERLARLKKLISTTWDDDKKLAEKPITRKQVREALWHDFSDHTSTN